MWAKRFAEKGYLWAICFFLLFVLISPASAAVSSVDIDIGTLGVLTSNTGDDGTDDSKYTRFTTDVAGVFQGNLEKEEEEEPPEDPC